VAKFQQIIKTLCVGAAFVNVWLFGFGYLNDLYDLQILAIVNLIFLSFALLYEKKT
jgi:hypothetical protein